jgi:Tfp pilus assembly protein PilO
MADGKTSDWTAGLLIIAATVLVGAGIPLALWLGVYQPKVQEHTAKREQRDKLHEQLQDLFVREGRVNDLRDDVKYMQGRLEGLQVSTFIQDERPENELIKAAEELNLAADHHNLAVPDDRYSPTAQVVTPGQGRIRWRHGLRASQLEIHAIGTYHDIARFLADIENRPELLVIPDTMNLIGDQTAERRLHTLMMRVYVLDARDIEAIGKDTPEVRATPGS